MKWRELLGAKAPSIADLESSLAALQAEATAAAAETSALAAGRRAVLLDGTDEALRKHDEKAGAAARRRDRAEVAAEEISAKLDTARADAAEAVRRARYDAAATTSAAAQAKLRRAYPEAARVLRDLLRQLAEAEIAVAEANADRPAGADKLPGPELFRLGRGAGEKVLSTREVELWVGRDGKPWRAEVQEHVVQSADGTGYIPHSKPGGPLQGARKLRLIETTFLPAENFRYVGALAASLTLPGLMPGEVDGWAPLANLDFTRPDGFARTVMGQLAQVDDARPLPPRAPKVRYEPVNPADLYVAPQGSAASYTGNVHPEMAENR